METKYLILDTNILLLDALNLELLAQPGTVVVLPETVVNELDSKKSVPGELGYQARSLGRLIAKSVINPVVSNGDLVITPLTLESGGEVHITSSTYPAFEVDEHTLNDRKIIYIAEQYVKLYGNTQFMSNDVMCRITALALGLDAIDLKVTERTSYEFIKDLTISDPEVFRTLSGSDILDVDPSYIPENYSYRFSSPETIQVKLATIVDGKISELTREVESAIRKQDCPPINAEQLLISKAILDTRTDLIVVEGLAGSGKNVVALSNAIRLLKTSKNKYDGIVYVRSPTNDESPGESIGFLSGNDEKLAMYLGPMEDTVDFIVRQSIKRKSSESQEDFNTRVDTATHKLKAECGMEATISTGWRGRTLHNKILILDEWANASLATSQKMLTRVGKDCKVIVIGSLNQIDSPYLSKFNNGLSILLDQAATRSVDTELTLHATTLHRVVRSEMAMFAEHLHTQGN